MPQTTKTFMTSEQGQALASAILHLANAVTQTDGLMGALPRAQAARDLVHDLAFPDHAEKPSPTPAPSCDAPHCDCDTGEDCHANGAADEAQPAWTIARVDYFNVGDMLQLSDGCEQIHFAIPAAMGYEAMKDVLHSVWRDLDLIPIVSKRRVQPFDVAPDTVATLPPGTRIDTNALHPDLAARLDGLKAAVDALAERLERKAGGGGGPYMPRTPRVVHSVEVSATVNEASQLGDVWWIKPHPAIRLGSLICEGEEGNPMEVVDFHELADGELSVVVRPAAEG